jgi:hypothetical protein
VQLGDDALHARVLVCREMEAGGGYGERSAQRARHGRHGALIQVRARRERIGQQHVDEQMRSELEGCKARLGGHAEEGGHGACVRAHEGALAESRAVRVQYRRERACVLRALGEPLHACLAQRCPITYLMREAIMDPQRSSAV